MQDITQLLTNRNFDSFAELSDLAEGWGTEFRQLSAEQFPPQIFQGRLSSLLLTNGRFGCQLDQRGTTPPGMRTFAVPNSGCSEFRWFGHSVDANSLLLFPAHGEIECISRAGFSVFTFCIPVELLEKNAHWCGLPETGSILASSEAVLRLNEEEVEPLRTLLRLTRWLTTASNETPSDNQYYEGIQDQVLFYTLRLFARQTNLASPRLKKKHLAMRQVLEFIEANKHKPLRILRLSKETDVSVRSLQMLFKQEMGMTLKAYLSGQRLYGAHRDLWDATQSDLHVSDVARKWGYWHMSQFSADYHKLFDELPSSTLSRSA